MKSIFKTFCPLPGIIVFFIFIAVSCGRYSPEIESALELAGDNREELEKVLYKYKGAGNRQKRRAAEFLITSLPYHYTNNSTLLDTFRCYLASQDRLVWGTLHTFENGYGSLDRSHYKKIPDIETITSDYLIRNIEFSFRVWKEAPWACRKKQTKLG